MSTARTIAKNTTVLFIAQIISYILGFFITMYTARHLGAEGFGILSLALSITGIFGVISDMGLSSLMVRDIAREKSQTNRYLSNVALMKIPLALLMFLIIVIIVNLFDYTYTTKTVVYLIAISTIINGFGGVLASVFHANEKLEYLSINIIINGVLMLIGTMVGIAYNLDILYFALIYIISTGITFSLTMVFFVWKFPLPKLEIDLSFWKPTIKEAWPFGITGLSGMLYTFLDSIMLSVMIGMEVVGWYSAAYRLILVTLFIPNAVNMAIFPVMSRFYKSSKDSLNLINERYFKYMIMLGIPLGAGTTILADKIILLVFGPRFEPSIIALQILIWTIVLTFAGASSAQLLVSINKQLSRTKISIICLLFNFVLNLILIPEFSYVGASVATVLTEIISVSAMIFICYKLGYGIPKTKVVNNLSKVLFATLIMSALIWYFRDLNLFLLIVMGTLLYFAVLYLVKGIDDLDRVIIKQILNKKELSKDGS
ncbi:MAG: flippase [Methanobacteriaceae archaeon]